VKSIGTALEDRAAEALALLHRIGSQYPSTALASSLIDAATENTAAKGLIQ
jgi:hypothetical protein